MKTRRVRRQSAKGLGTLTASQPHIIMIGNPVDGFNFIGPFENATAAAEHGNTDGDIDAEWWIAPLEQP